MSGITRSTPKSSDSGNIMPASMTMISSPTRSTSMFMPNSPRPSRGMAVRVCAVFGALLLGVLLKETSTPQPKPASYHTPATRDWKRWSEQGKKRSFGALMVGIASEEMGDRDKNHGAKCCSRERIPEAATKDSQLRKNPAPDVRTDYSQYDIRDTAEAAPALDFSR